MASWQVWHHDRRVQCHTGRPALVQEEIAESAWNSMRRFVHAYVDTLGPAVTMPDKLASTPTEL